MQSSNYIIQLFQWTKGISLKCDAGKLFENNKKGLIKALKITVIIFKKVKAKKNTLKYTNFRHFKKLNSIIS